MTQVSYSNLFDIEHEHGCDEAIQPGDLVRMGPNLFPHFTIMAVVGDKVWVRNVQSAADGIALTSRCRRINGEPIPAE